MQLDHARFIKSYYSDAKRGSEADTQSPSLGAKQRLPGSQAPSPVGPPAHLSDENVGTNKLETF